MKTLKFRPDLVEKILDGSKTSTWRLFDDKSLSVGDKIDFLNWETQEKFGVAILTSVKVKTMGTLTDEDWKGHETYQSEEDMYKHYRQYYGNNVGPDTEVKLIDFEFKAIR